MSPPGGQRCKRRVACKVCWQLSFVLPLGVAYVALTDARSVHASHAERAGWLRGRLGEAGRLVWCSMLAHAVSWHTYVDVYLGPDLRCAGRRASMAGRCTHFRTVLRCTFHVRDALETRYSYTCMGHTTTIQAKVGHRRCGLRYVHRCHRLTLPTHRRSRVPDDARCVQRLGPP